MNNQQQCRELDEASAEVVARDEGILANHVVGGLQVGYAPILRQNSRLRIGRIAVDDAHGDIALHHTRTGQPNISVLIDHGRTL